MDPHVPHGPINSVKDFLIHIGIVTVGILIALGLEQLVEAHNHASRATEAVEEFRQELNDNRIQVEEVLKAMPEMRADIDGEIARLNAPPGDAATGDAAKIHYPGIHFDLTSNASWEAAVATQALGDLPYDDVHRYAEAFGVFRLFQDEERAGLAAWQDMHVFGDDRSKLSADDRRSLVERLRQYAAFTHTLDLVGKGALESCDRALQPR